MGGDLTFGPGGDVHEVLASSGIDTSNIKPLYCMEKWTGEAMNLLEAGSPPSFYLYNAVDGALFKIAEPNDLATIVEHLNDDDQGLASLNVEPLS